MSIPRAALAFELRREGGFVNNPRDPGGATMCGVTQAVYDADRDARHLPRRSVRFIAADEIQSIYDRLYWRAAACDTVASLAGDGLALALLDCAVNSGPRRAVELLQEAVGCPVTGSVDLPTIKALRGVEQGFALRSYLTRRESFYCAIPDRRPASGEFLEGWLKRLAILAAQCGSSWRPSPAAVAKGEALAVHKEAA